MEIEIVNIVKTARLLALALLASAYSFAAGTGGVPQWENPMQKIANSLTGPMAYFIALVGLVIIGASILYSHELGVFGQKASIFVMAIGILAFAAPILGSVFGVTAAVV